MDEGIAIAQRSTYAWFDVEFTEGEEPEITDDKANGGVTAILSCWVLKSLPQGTLVESESSVKSSSTTISFTSTLMSRRRWEAVK